MTRYDLNTSIASYKLYQLICESIAGLHYHKLIELTGKNKNVVTDQLRPLKEKGLVGKKYDKVVKDYLFYAIDKEKKYPCPCCGVKI